MRTEASGADEFLSRPYVIRVVVKRGIPDSAVHNSGDRERDREIVYGPVSTNTMLLAQARFDTTALYVLPTMHARADNDALYSSRRCNEPALVIAGKLKRYASAAS